MIPPRIGCLSLYAATSRRLVGGDESWRDVHVIGSCNGICRHDCERAHVIDERKLMACQKKPWQHAISSPAFNMFMILSGLEYFHDFASHACAQARAANNHGGSQHP
jgi:hypothetical protein